MSNYKTETKTGLPIKYLKDTKADLWEKIKKFVETNIQNYNSQKNYINEIDNLCRYLKRFYKKELEVVANRTVIHNECISHCFLYAFGTCTESHNNECDKCGKLFTIFHKLKKDISNTLHDELDEYLEYLLYYLAHQTRKTYLNSQFNANLLELDEKGTLIIKDSLELDIQAHDYWSNDPRQDAFFTASSLYAVIESMEKKPKPEWVIIISDNGSHYYNSDLMMILRYWSDWYGIWSKKWIFLEPGEAKTTIDSHHAQIAHTINRHIKLGFDISSGNDIETAISGICGISVSYLKPDRKKDLEKLQLKTIKKPNPNLSIPLTSENIWTVPLPNNTGIQVKRLKKELESRDILKEIDTNKKDLIKELKIELAKETLLKISDNVEYSSNLSSSNNSSSNKRGGKRISKKVWNLLQEYFLEGNIDKSERHTAQSMLSQLKQCAENGIIEEEEIPKLETIRNWIFRYASQHR
ncbi:hypothetical protein Glove_166g93 [Diversispora epigaea]|uniref:Uncharacterized protein n=1 Tax=Diversispora epigaea TaxID=1348612 RepID=A0A397IQT6_9GLOM|nr:hypothetical protein Glove_166g93 [Diversispora epigaea]